MIQQVLQAVQDAFTPQKTESHLQEAEGRVFGSVTVIGSALFDDLDDTRRQQRLWASIRSKLGAQSADVGPVVLR